MDGSKILFSSASTLQQLDTERRQVEKLLTGIKTQWETCYYLLGVKREILLNKEEKDKSIVHYISR